MKKLTHPLIITNTNIIIQTAKAFSIAVIG